VLDGFRDLRPDLVWIPEVHRHHRDAWLCHEPSSAPPPLPAALRAAGVRAAGTDLVLTSKDGTAYRAHLARAAGSSENGIVIAPDVRGLHPFYAQLADRFAEAGVNAIAFDYFGRSLGTTVPQTSFYEGSWQTAPYREHVSKTVPALIQQDLAAAAAHLRKETGTTRVFVTGFCFGGRVALNAAAEQQDATGVIGFYGAPIPRSPEDQDAPSLKAGRMKAAVLALYGGADAGIPQAAVDELARALAAAGVKHQVHTYPGAPHSFFDRTFVEHAAAAEDAWKGMLAFIRTGDPAAV